MSGTNKFFDVLKAKNGGQYAKVSADRLVAIKDGREVVFERDDYLDVRSKEDQLNSLAYGLEQGWYDEETYNKRVNAVEKTPDFVLFQITKNGVDQHGKRCFIKLGDVLEGRDGGKYVSVSCDKLISTRKGYDFSVNYKDALTMLTTEKELKYLEIDFKMGKIKEDVYEKIRSHAEDRPDWVLTRVVHRSME